MALDERATAGVGGEPALVYVSWGGTGRAASLREAMRRAIGGRRPLVYLAVLDDGGFADLDDSMIELLAAELGWLLDAQTELTRAQLGSPDLPVEVVVRAGDVPDLVAEVVAGLGRTEVLIGAPVPVAGRRSLQAITELIEERTSCPVSVVAPGGGPGSGYDDHHVAAPD